MADEEENEEVVSEEAPSGGGKNPIVTVMLIVNAFAFLGVAYLQWQYMKKEASKPSVRDIVQAEMQQMKGSGEKVEEGTEGLENEFEEPDGVLIPLEGFTANLAQGDGPRRFVRLNTVLKFSKESKESEFKARQPQIRDTIIAILNSKRPEDLLKKEGKAFLKEEIKASINSFLVDGHVQDIYYVGFQIN